MASPVLSLASLESHLEERKLVRRLEGKVLVINNSDLHILQCVVSRETLGKIFRKRWENSSKHHCFQELWYSLLLQGAAFWIKESTGFHNPTDAMGGHGGVNTDQAGTETLESPFFSPDCRLDNVHVVRDLTLLCAWFSAPP